MEEVKYIPGDLVMFQDKVTTVRECRGNYYILNCQKIIEDAVHYTDLKPVSLTPEILEKNGWKRFVYDDDIFHEIELNCYSTLVVYFPQKDKKDISCGIFTDDLQGGKIISFFPTEIEYVHQLQHLLFGLGLDSSLKV